MLCKYKGGRNKYNNFVKYVISNKHCMMYVLIDDYLYLMIVTHGNLGLGQSL